MPPKSIRNDESLVSACGLYCAACRSYQKGRCPGCAKNDKAKWCGVRTCNRERGRRDCSDCRDYPDPMACKHFNNRISRIIGFVLNSNRAACIARIKECGREAFAAEMAAQGRQTLPRRT